MTTETTPVTITLAIEESDAPKRGKKDGGYKTIHAAGCRDLIDPEPFTVDPNVQAIGTYLKGYDGDDWDDDLVRSSLCPCAKNALKEAQQATVEQIDNLMWSLTIHSVIDKQLDSIRDAVAAVLTVQTDTDLEDAAYTARLIASAAVDNLVTATRENAPENPNHEPTYAVLAQRLVEAEKSALTFKADRDAIEAAKERLETRVRSARKLIDDYCNQGGRQTELDRLENIDAALTGTEE